MYTVQAHVLVVDPSITYPATECARDEWTDIATINQLYSDQEELDEARTLLRIARTYYTQVRIVKSRPGGERMIVR
jgi:hypothetical protein